jgi:hypothetical protein
VLLFPVPRVFLFPVRFLLWCSDVNISLIGFAGSNFDCNIELHLLSLGGNCSEQR